MRVFKLGGLLKKTVIIDDGGQATIKTPLLPDGQYDAKDIKTVFLSEPAFLKDGELFLSTTGDTFSGNPAAQTGGFLYSKKQASDVREIIDLLKKSNKELEIKESGTKGNETSSNAVKCPNCGSTDVVFLENKKKSFSIGKAVAGGVLTGGIGTLAGFVGKKGKDRWHCQNCGNTFETK